MHRGLLLLAFAPFSLAIGLNSLEDSIQQFKSPRANKKLPGTNIYHLHFEHGNRKQNLEDCAALTIKLNGKSFDFFLFDCYINAADASTHMLEYTLKYEYFERVSAIPDRNPTPDRNPIPDSSWELYPTGYPMVCARPNRRRNLDGESCSPPPYEFPPTYTDLDLLKPPSYCGSQESHEEIVKIGKAISSKQALSFESTFFKEFGCRFSVESIGELSSLTMNCMNPITSGEPTKDYYCLKGSFDPKYSESEFEVYGGPLEPEVVKKYDYKTPPKFCPATSEMVDFYSELAFMLMDYPMIKTSSRPYELLLQTQSPGQPNVLLPSAVHFALFMRDKSGKFYRNDYFSVFRETKLYPTETAISILYGQSCYDLSQFLVGDIKDKVDQHKYERLYDDLNERTLFASTTLERYFRILRNDLKPWVAIDLATYLKEEPSAVHDLFETCGKPIEVSKTIGIVDLDGGKFIFDQSKIKYLLQSPLKNSFEFVYFPDHRCTITLNYVRYHVMLNCAEKGKSLDHDIDYSQNCMYSEYDKDVAKVTLLGIGNFEDQIDPPIMNVLRLNGRTIPELCPPTNDLLRLHDELAQSLGKRGSMGTDRALTNLIVGRKSPEANYLMSFPLCYSLWLCPQSLWHKRGYSYRREDEQQIDEYYLKCKGIADYTLEGVENSASKFYRGLYKDMYRRNFFGGHVKSATRTTVRTYLNSLLREGLTDFAIELMSMLRNVHSDDKLGKLFKECDLKGPLFVLTKDFE